MLKNQQKEEKNSMLKSTFIMFLEAYCQKYNYFCQK